MKKPNRHIPLISSILAEVLSAINATKNFSPKPSN